MTCHRQWSPSGLVVRAFWLLLLIGIFVDAVAEIVRAPRPTQQPAAPMQGAEPANKGEQVGLPAEVSGPSKERPAELAAEAGDMDATPFVRAMAAYRRGHDTRRYTDAARWFQEAATGGEMRAQIALGYLQSRGLGLTRDPASGMRRLQQASVAGYARADYIISLLQNNDRRTDVRLRMESLRASAARRGDAVAQNAMGVNYQLQGDRSTAEMWYRRAAEHGSESAVRNLAGLARSEVRQGQVAKTVQSAEAGDAGSLFELARRYHRGDGVPLDYMRAIQLYRAASAQGSEQARRMIGLIQSRTDVSGNIDPTWMRQLASTLVEGAGRKALEPSISDETSQAPINDDPLSGLLTVLPVAPSPLTPTRIP
jgi:uncharacterized protein